jgi:hypothetical protein
MIRKYLRRYFRTKVHINWIIYWMYTYNYYSSTSTCTVQKNTFVSNNKAACGCASLHRKTIRASLWLHRVPACSACADARSARRALGAPVARSARTPATPPSAREHAPPALTRARYFRKYFRTFEGSLFLDCVQEGTLLPLSFYLRYFSNTSIAPY